MDAVKEDNRQLFWVATAVLSLALAAVFASLWIGARGTDAEQVSDFLAPESSAATAVATDAITAITTYDASSLDDRRAELLEISTGDFRSDYEALLEQGLGEALEETAIESEGDIVDGPTVGFTSATRAIAVARVVQDVTSRDTPGGRTVFLVVRLGLVLDGEDWKADSLKILSQQIL